MAKVQQISEITPSFAFTEYDFYKDYEKSFKKSELGRIHSVLPLCEMAVRFGLRDPHPHKKAGRKSHFSPEGKVALMFLKAYSGLSAPKLMEQLNANIHYQLFCGIRICPGNPLTNYKLIDDIALDLSSRLKIQNQQEALAEAWKPYMKNLDALNTDATCYESAMRYPTDVKLLWECIEKAYPMMCGASRELGVRRMRTKYLDVSRDNMAYVKQRRHTQKRTRRMIHRLLELLGKILAELRRLGRENPCAGLFSKSQLAEMETITKIYRQQRSHHGSGNARESIPNRIVSVSKPYVRPIVRGKEIKKVEFGAKCNNIQVDGISFIEKLSFNAFNEGTRLVHCVKLAEKLFGEKITRLGGDCSYSGNENRSFCSGRGIETSFSQKGRKRESTASVSIVKKELARVRATAMEGSFGTQKEHYGLKRINGRIKKTEILIIFFGIHTANAVQLAKRTAEAELCLAA
ncbi:MAG: transposase [Bacteroidaceae bacterium]|nr:transposase [Bacteroidaceae bacterium]